MGGGEGAEVGAFVFNLQSRSRLFQAHSVTRLQLFFLVWPPHRKSASVVGLPVVGAVGAAVGEAEVSLQPSLVHEQCWLRLQALEYVIGEHSLASHSERLVGVVGAGVGEEVLSSHEFLSHAQAGSRLQSALLNGSHLANQSALVVGAWDGAFVGGVGAVVGAEDVRRHSVPVQEQTRGLFLVHWRLLTRGEQTAASRSAKLVGAEGAGVGLSVATWQERPTHAQSREFPHALQPLIWAHTYAFLSISLVGAVGAAEGESVVSVHEPLRPPTQLQSSWLLQLRADESMLQEKNVGVVGAEVGEPVFARHWRPIHAQAS